MFRIFASFAAFAIGTSCASTRSVTDGPSRRSEEPEVSAGPSHEPQRSWNEGDAYQPREPVSHDGSDVSWKRLVAFVYPSTGNSLEAPGQASQSHFRTRRSRVSGDGTMSYAELLVSARTADFEAMLRARGFTATFLETAPQHPEAYNTIVEVCTYLDEDPQDFDMGPLDMEIETPYYVRTLLPAASTEISTGPVRVHKNVRKSNFSSWDTERYVGALMKAQGAAQVRVVDWVTDRVKE